jgi:hypothetical protein
LVDKKGKAIDGQATFRMRHFMGNNGKVFNTGLIACCVYSKFFDVIPFSKIKDINMVK